MLNLSAAATGTKNGWNINWGDTSTTSASSAATTYTATFQAVDEDGTYTTSVVVTVAEAAQSASIDPVGSILPLHNQNFTFRLADTGGDVPDWTIRWGDNSPPQLVNAAACTTVSHSYPANGSYTLTATAVDEDGAFTATQALTVTDHPAPWVSGAGVNEGSVYTLNGGFTDDAGDPATGWRVRWGDGTADTVYNAAGGPFTHVYAEAGNYPVSATAYDVDGSVTVNTWAGVGEGPTTASAWGVSSVTEGGASFYTLSFSFTDPDLAGWYVDWGDQSPTTPGLPSQSTATHAYSEPGSYNVTFVGLDEDHPLAAPGNTNFALTASTQVTVNEATGAAAGILGSSTVTEGSQYSMQLAFADAGGDQPLERRVDWGDGGAVQIYTNPSTNVFTHVYNDASAHYTITATAVTEDGSYSTTQDLKVLGVPPLLRINGSTIATQGSNYVLNLVALYPPNDPDGETPGSLTWTINWGDGPDATHPDLSTLPGSSVENFPHVYTQAGHYLLTATATDDDATWGPVVLNGQLDVGFGGTGVVETDFAGQSDQGRSIALQPNGSGGFHIIAAGITTATAGGTGGVAELALTRFDSNGVRDLYFGSPGVQGSGEVIAPFGTSAGSALAIEPDGSILVVGALADGGFALAHYGPDGVLDTGFGTNGVASYDFNVGSQNGAVALAVQSRPGGDRIVVGGNVAGHFTLVRFAMDGTLDTTFGPLVTALDGGAVSGSLAIDADYNLLVAGTIGHQVALSRYTPDGQIDTSFGTPPRRPDQPERDHQDRPAFR